MSGSPERTDCCIWYVYKQFSQYGIRNVVGRGVLQAMSEELAGQIGDSGPPFRRSARVNPNPNLNPDPRNGGPVRKLDTAINSLSAKHAYPKTLYGFIQACRRLLMLRTRHGDSSR